MTHDTKTSSVGTDLPQRRSADQPEVSKVFAGGGEVGALMRTVSWSESAVGPVETWPQSLRTAVSICLGSKFPMFVWWGRDLTVFYNDAYAPILGPHKHPRFLGRSAKEQWAEVWNTLGPLTDQVIHAETATWFEDFHLYPVMRQGFAEDTYFTFSYSPIRDESGKVGGVFCACQETTQRVLAERRLRNLRELGQQTSNPRTVADASQLSADVLSANAADLPFSLIYLGDSVGRRSLRLEAATGVVLDRRHVPTELGLEGDVQPLAAHTARALQERAPIVLDAPFEILGPLAQSPWPEPLRSAVFLPITSSDQVKPAGVLIVGITPRLPFDEDYRGYLELVAGQLATAVATANAREEEKRRAEALAEIDRAKTAFFSNVSHEFRTPLTLILGPLEDALASAEQVLGGAQLAMVHHNAQRLLKHVNSLLDFSRIEAGKFRAAYVPTDLATLTADVASAFRSLVERAGLRLTVECSGLPEPIWVDHSMWEKVVSNLLSNAFKFTFEGEIAIRLQWCGDHVELAIEDTGTGIPEDALPQLFQRFNRVEGAKGRSYEGSGIGLALVQEIVRVHGGTIAVTSEVERGSTFTVSIPTGCAHLPDDQVLSTKAFSSTTTTSDAFVLEASAWLDASSSPPPSVGRTVPPADTGEPRLGVRQGRVLVADDNADMREYVRRLLSRRFTVDAVADGEAALAWAVADPPDLILSDVMMPGLDGFALLRALRANEKTTNVPVVLLSARAGEEAKIEGLLAGASDYVVKPFSSRELVARVEGAIHVARARARLSEVLEAMGDAFYVVDRDWRYISVNAGFERITTKPRADTIGRTIWDVFPDAAAPDSKYWVELGRCMAERVPVQFVEYYAPLDLWTDVRGYPTAEGIAVFFRDVSEEKRSEVALKQQAEFEQQLVGIVSHDLRNPLNVIQLGSNILLQSGAHDERTMKTLARIASSTGRAIRLVRDLLDFTQARLGGGIPIVAKAIDLHVLARQTIDEVQANYPERDLEIAADGNAEGQWDPDRLAQVVTNLVSNALKYSPTNSRVHVQTHGSIDEVELRVHNAGAPIPAEAREHLFEPMQRASAQVDIAGRSVGLGLYIVKEIVTRHGGRIDVTSTEADGTTFTVRLPRSPVSFREPGRSREA